MGEIYSPGKHKEPAAAGLPPTLLQESKEIVVSFGGACREAVSNVVSTVGISSLAAEDRTGDSPLKAAVGGAFTPLSGFAFMVFVLL